MEKRGLRTSAGPNFFIMVVSSILPMARVSRLYMVVWLARPTCRHTRRQQKGRSVTRLSHTKACQHVSTGVCPARPISKACQHGPQRIVNSISVL